MRSCGLQSAQKDNVVPVWCPQRLATLLVLTVTPAEARAGSGGQHLANFAHQLEVYCWI